MRGTPRRRPGRGGQGGHEPRARIRTRELRATELAVLGWSQSQIAQDLGITQAAVCKLLQRTDTRHLRELTETIGRQKARQALRLDHVYAEAIGSWHASKTDRTRRRQRQTQGGDGPGATVAELVVENQHGDPRYLDVALKALADRRKLVGLDAPQKVDLRASREPYDDMTEEALLAELARNTRLLGVVTPTVIDGVSTDAVTADPTHTVAIPPDTSPVSKKEMPHVDPE